MTYNPILKKNRLAGFSLLLLLGGTSLTHAQLDTTTTLSMDSVQSPQIPEPLEAVNLSSQGAFTSQSPKVGDSLDYILQVEWQETGVPVLVLAPDSLHFEGFKIIGQATVHKKLAQGMEIHNHTEFIYRLRAETQGNGRATSVKLRYLSGISKAEEAVFIPPTLVDILPAPVKIMEMLWFKLLAGLCLFGGALALAWGVFKFTVERRKRPEPEKLDLRPEVAALKNRIKSTYNSPEAAKDITLSMEVLAKKYLVQEIAAIEKSKMRTKIKVPTKVEPGIQDKVGIEGKKFEPLLEQFLSLIQEIPSSDSNQALTSDWAKLKDLFRHARFAGGNKEAHELQDAFRTFKKCLKITGEDEHE